MKRKSTTRSDRARQPPGTRLRLLAVILAVGLGAVVLGTFAARHGASDLSVEGILAADEAGGQHGGLTITYPLDQTLFPPDIAPPTFCWRARQEAADVWAVTIRFQDRVGGSLSALRLVPEWTPSDVEWEAITRRSAEHPAKVRVLGVNRAAPRKILAAAEIGLRTSQDAVGAPIFYREVHLPFLDAVKDPSRIRWRFGPVSCTEQPPIVLANLPVCGNCHSFSADGKVLGMDVDYANDKGSYAMAAVADEMTLNKGSIVTWSDYERADGEPTFGLLSQVSPDGRYVVSTVKDRSVFVPRNDLAFSQLFFPIKGILAIYDRQTKQFYSLPGADDKRFVHSNPNWSPDGKFIVFARSHAYQLKRLRNDKEVLLTQAECREFLEEGKTFLFDLYRIPFNEGRGGQAEPLAGASNNGLSNYFPRFSPDGKWIVFCQARSFMLLQPDSELFIVPAQGGAARRLECNTGRMNSWHSWSPDGKWLVFASKANSPYTQLFLTHVDAEGRSSPPVLLSRFTAADRAANIPEFVNAPPDAIRRIREQFVDDHSFARSGAEAFKYGDPVQAEKSLRKALELNPQNADALCNLGNVLVNEGRLEEAKAYLTKALEYQADLPQAHQNLGVILYREEKFAEAIAHWRDALRIDPDYSNAHVSLGIHFLGHGQFTEANRHFSAAVELRPDDAIVRYHLGATWDKLGQPAQAAMHFHRALQLAPDAVPALLGLAAIHSTSADPTLRDPSAGIRLAERACKLTRYEYPQALLTLSDAYREAGRLPEAISVAQRALDIVRKAGDQRSAKDIQQRINACRDRMRLPSSAARP